MDPRSRLRSPADQGGRGRRNPRRLRRDGGAIAASRVRAVAVVVAIAAAAAACGDLLQEPDTGKLPARLVKVSGDGQTGAAGGTLAQPARVKVVDPEGLPVARLWVEWSVLEGGGEVSPRNGFSGEDGMTETTWTLGPAAGLQTIQAFVRKDNPMTFDATATPVTP